MILVTGGAGFIGSVLVHELNKLSETDIVIVDRLEDAIKWKNLRGLKYSEYIHADDLFNGNYDELINETEMIYHMGASSDTTITDMDFLMKNNVAYTKALFEFAAKKNIPIIYASSAATYGDGELGYDDEEEQIPNLMPLNPYGYSKQLVDEWVLKESTLKPDHWFGLKFFNVFGPNEYHKGEMRSLVNKAYFQINENGNVKLFKSHRSDFQDGEQLRDFIYVKDVVKVMILLSYTDKADFSGIYNLGAGKARSFKDLVMATYKSMDKSPSIEYIDMPITIRDQYQYYTCAKTDKLLSVIPQFKFTELEDAIYDYVRNHLQNPNPHL
jgi:ADP-L-glycero-D-manno-heptose 6-epimerase